MHAHPAWLVVPILLLCACRAPEPIIACDAADGLEPVCGFQNPEDLAVLPGSRALLVSQFGDMEGGEPGSLARFDLTSRELAVLFRGGQAPADAGPGEWGDADCPGPPPAAFAPHGIHLSRRGDGALQLLVVNHGGRESIELFEVAPDGRALTWRGCAVPPDEAYLNAVVATPEGGFLATHMFERSSRVAPLLGMLGFDTGHVLEWTRGRGWTVVPGTEAPFPNGIELSPDGGTIYLNAYLAGEVRKIDRRSGETLGVAEVAHPDNTRWNADGTRLLVASHTGAFTDMLGCQQLEEGSCPLAFEIVAVDPETMARQTLLAHEGPPMGAATVAVEVDGALYMGSFKSDRLLVKR